jgi:hypothetical protein
MPSTLDPLSSVSPGPGFTTSASSDGTTSTAALSAIQDHVADPVGAHLGSAISYAAGAAWADGTTNPNSTVQAQLSKILTDLTSVAADTGAGKIYKGVSGAWADGTTIAAGQMNLWLNTIVSDLAATTGGDDGAGKIGWDGGATWADTVANPATTVRLQLEKIITDLTDTTGHTGAGKLYKGISGAWADGTTIAAGQMNLWLNTIVSDLASQANGDDGAIKIGSYLYAGTGTSLSTGTVRSQLLELANECGGLATSNVWSADQQFDGDLIATASNSTPNISQARQTGTGVSTSYSRRIIGQPGKLVVAGTNNDGGDIQILTGEPGTGGTGGNAGKFSVLYGNTAYNMTDTSACSGEVAWVAAGTTLFTIPIADGEFVEAEVVVLVKKDDLITHVGTGRWGATIKRDGTTVSLEGATQEIFYKGPDVSFTIAFVGGGPATTWKVDISSGVGHLGSCSAFLNWKSNKT